MSNPAKVLVISLLDGDTVNSSIANQPHINLETNFDNILNYLSDGSSIGYFETDISTTTGLIFGYKSGKIITDNNSIVVAAGTVSLITNSINYIEIDSIGNIYNNTTGFTSGKIHLWKLTTNSSSITVYEDVRNWVEIKDDFGLPTTVNGTAYLNGSISLTGNSSGNVYFDALTNEVLLANNSGNGQLIIQDGAAGTTNQVILNGTTGSITVSGNTVWNAGNDGTGSGLDADLLDGLLLTSFVRNDSDSTINNLLQINKTNPATYMILKDTLNNVSMNIQVDALQDFIFMPAISGIDQTGYELRYDLNLDEWQIGTNKIWHAGNDGTGSGLDADLLDGQNFNYYEQIIVDALSPVDTPDYISNKIVAGRAMIITIENPGANEQLNFQDTPPVFITPIQIHYGTGGSGTTAWATYDASATIPAGAEYAIFEAEGTQSGPDSGNINSYIQIRKDNTTSSYNAFINRASGNNDNLGNANQSIMPITTTRTFDWRFLYISNGWGYLRLIGYW